MPRATKKYHYTVTSDNAATTFDFIAGDLYEMLIFNAEINGYLQIQLHQKSSSI